MSLIPSLTYIQQCLTRYVLTPYMIFGTIGLLCNIAVFSQSAYRQTTTSLYILAMSFCALVSMYAYLIPTIYAFSHPDLVTSSLFFCQFIYYLRHTFNQMMRTFFILACIDRYAICSNHVRIRSFSQYRVAIRIIPLVAIFWLLLSIFPLMLRSLVDGVCDAKSGIDAIIFSIYGAIVAGVLPLIFAIIFSVLLSISLKRVRTRIQPVTNTNVPGQQVLRRRDRDMLRMLSIEVICYTIALLPLTIVFVYQAATQTITKISTYPTSFSLPINLIHSVTNAFSTEVRTANNENMPGLKALTPNINIVRDPQ